MWFVHPAADSNATVTNPATVIAHEAAATVTLDLQEAKQVMRETTKSKMSCG